jgi:hypothetical protein
MLITSVNKLYTCVIGIHQQDVTHAVNGSFSHICNMVNQMKMEGMELFYVLSKMQAIITNAYITEGTSGCHS